MVRIEGDAIAEPKFGKLVSAGLTAEVVEIAQAPGTWLSTASTVAPPVQLLSITAIEAPRERAMRATRTTSDGETNAEQLSLRQQRWLCQDIGFGGLLGAFHVEQLLREGLITEDDIAGEIGKVICGELEGRQSDEQITVFDSTGIALQDSATVPLEVERAIAAGVGIEKKMIST